MRRGNPQVGKHLAHRLREHRGPTIAVDRQGTLRNPFLDGRFPDQFAGNLAGFLPSKGPANHIPTENVQQHIEPEILALHRPSNHRDIPRPDLLNPGRQQFRLRITGMPKLIPPFRSCAILTKDPVHGSHRSQVNSFFQQGGMHFPDGAIRKPLTVKGGPNGFPFLGTQGSWNRFGLARATKRFLCLAMSIKSRSGYTQIPTGFANAQAGIACLYFRNQSMSEFGSFSRGKPIRLATFF